ATVLSNEDPNQKGRVQVQFQWQTAGMKTSWIRVMTPDAGSSDHHSQNRGHVFVPEVGDQVMVDFRYNDPNRPFVMGSMYHGNNGAGGQDQNNIKSIITKSGHVLEFNDTNNSESITITDKNNNIIFIDTNGNNITISANETITLKAKNINLDAEENITATSGKMTEVHAGENIMFNAGENIELSASENLIEHGTNKEINLTGKKTVIASEIEETADKIRLDSSKGNLELASGKEIDLQSGEKVRLF
ncbi:phage baseplate assembly protein V, partial [Tenacibaculum finnmarkense]